MRASVVVGLSLWLSGGALACDDILLALIHGQGEVSEFDRRIELLSTHLGAVATAARKGNWVQARGHYSRGIRVWLDVYRKYLRHPPPGLRDHPDWKGFLGSLSERVGALKALIDVGEFDPLHREVQDTQALLVSGYLRGGTTPQKAATDAFLVPLHRIDRLIEKGERGSARESLRAATARFDDLCGLDGARDLESLEGLVRDRMALLEKNLDAGTDIRVRDDARLLVETAREFTQKFLERAFFPPLEGG